jgi:hypothetical protein
MDFVPIDRVTTIMSKSICNPLNSLFTKSTLFKEEEREITVCPFSATSNVVNLTSATTIDDKIDSSTMIINVKPVSYVESISVEGNFFSSYQIGNEKRNHFLGKLVRSKVV